MLSIKVFESVVLSSKDVFRCLNNRAKAFSFSIRCTQKQFSFISSADLEARNACTVSDREYLSLKSYKDVSGPYPPAYDPAEVEKGWYEWWEDNGFFKPEFLLTDKKSDNVREVFSMVLPPPNITGNLHLGHTLTVTIQDTLTRWHRMLGKPVLWVPGYDHGGIATQAIIEKKLLKEKKLNRHQLGKENFLMEVTKWKETTQKTIEEQLRKIGSSLDFSRSSFTMDSHTSDAVVAAFIQLFEENLIYRKEAMINWSSAMKSVISDIEVDYIEVPGYTKLRVPGLPDPIEVGVLEFFYYPVTGSEEKLAVATTRLETMLGDSAVAVHPEDERHKHLLGKTVIHPFTGKEIPIIADQSINKEFGTGVMKVTPAHDFKDFELGERHNLSVDDILSDDGTIKNNIEIFGGQHRFIARTLVRDHLKTKGLYLEKKSHAMSIPLCSRTGDVVEPRVKYQWYLNCSTLATEAIKAVEEGRLKLIPEYHQKLWFEWFRHLKDWCISRQLWWGHPIPMYKVSHSSLPEEMNFWVAAKDKHEALQKGAKKLNVDIETISVFQDGDVLDTWFSSALFPLTSLGWPEKLQDLSKFYPLSLMETGYDIMFFWVARMVMLGYHFTGKLPFSEVLLHGMVCDSHGRKMTKSLGNILDPFDIIYGVSIENLCQRAKENYRHGLLSPEEFKLAVSCYRRSYPIGIPECGTDGLRLALLSHDVQNQRINIDMKGIRVCRNFCNKIWQGVRFFTKATENCPRHLLVPFQPQEVNITELGEVEQWILSRLSSMVSACNSSFENYEFHVAVSGIRHFWVQNFCDIYLEYVKSVLMSEEKDKQLVVCRIMLTCIEVFLRSISPVMPFLSEEIYQRLTCLTDIKASSSVTISSYPESETYSIWRNTVLEADLNTVTELVNVARSMKAQHGATKMRPKVTIAVDAENTLCALNRFSALIATLARLESVTFHLTQGQEFFEHHPQDSWVFQVHDHGISVIMEIQEHEVLAR